MSLLQVLLSQHGLLEAREQVAVLAWVSESICCFLVNLGQALLPKLYHPGGREAYAAEMELILIWQKHII